MVVVFIIGSIFEFYLFGMQRGSLKISRQNAIPWRGFGEVFLPKWFFSAVWISRIVKYGVLIFILISYGWKFGLILFGAVFLFSIILPIPYKLFYYKIYKKSITENKLLNDSDKEIFLDMLQKTF